MDAVLLAEELASSETLELAEDPTSGSVPLSGEADGEILGSVLGN
jgi:hypothetical protein